MENIYIDGTYLKNTKNWLVHHSPWKAQQVEKMITRNNISFQTIVEVGCGAGMILYELSKSFPNASMEGFDISPQVSELWNQLPPNKIEFKLENFLENNKNYDLLLLLDVFEHVPDYIGFLNSINKRAKFSIFHIPLDMNIQGLLRDLPIYFREKLGHLHYFSKSTALETLKYCGYEVIDYFYAPFNFDAPKSIKLKRRLINYFRSAIFKYSPDLAVNLLGGWSLVVLARTNE